MRVLSLAAGLLLAAALAAAGVFLAVETATIKISMPARYIEATATVHGALVGGQFKTDRTQVNLTESTQGSASGAANSPATYATGYVVFHYTCSYPPCNPTPRKAGWGVCAVHPSGGATCFALLSNVTCFCGESVAVRARGPGPFFNVDAHTVNLVEGPGAQGETVDNPASIVGGANATSSPVVLQSDIDGVGASLSSRLTAGLRSALRVRSHSPRFLVDSAPTISLSSDVSAGAHSGTFQVTASGSLGATVFFDAVAQVLIAKALSDTVPTGYHLSGPSVITDYQVQNSNPHGDVTVSGKATSYLVEDVSMDSLRSRLRGLDPAAARKMIQAIAPGSLVEIRLAPAPAPLLPFNADHISIVVVARY